MPLYNLKCPKCNEVTQKICEKKDLDTFVCKCGEKMIRAPTGASSSVKETWDNGLMARKAEFYSDIVEVRKNLGKSGPQND